MISKVLGIFIACAGYSFIFNVKMEKILYASLNCAFGYAVYLLLKPDGNYMALIIASFITTIISEILSRKTRTPATVFILCALLPLVPGVGAYTTVLFLMNSQQDLAMTYGFDTLVQAGSIVVGVSLASNLFRVYTQYKNRNSHKNTSA
ncbi:MAG: threonine/serine exporter family protein [Erysipelotrichaceae bacterium]|nr:threonine/serine exporter family protein [Erysipelotrichaceae bacterium]